MSSIHKAICSLTATIIIASYPFLSVKALEDDSSSKTKFANISQNCSSIKQSLASLERSDSRTRTYLGSAYEAISTSFITPLNLRLVKNNQTDTNLFGVQADFSEQQANFRSEYTSYMRELESLIAIDCQAHPDDFYRQLTETRRHREALHSTTVELSKLIKEQYSAVEALRKGL